MVASPKSYAVVFTRDALKALATLPPKVQRQVIGTAEALAKDPRPPKCKKLHGPENHWRVYSGNYRVVYTIEDQKILVTVVRIGHRKDVYRGL